MHELLKWTKILWTNFPLQTEMFTEQVWECLYVCMVVCVCVRMRARVCVGVNGCGLNAHAERFNWHFPVLPCDILQCVRCNTKYATVDTFVSISAKHLIKNDAIAMHNALCVITMFIYTHTFYASITWKSITLFKLKNNNKLMSC